MNEILGTCLARTLIDQRSNMAHSIKKIVTKKTTCQADYNLTKKIKQLGGLSLPEIVRLQMFRSIGEAISSTETWRESLD